MKVMGIKHLDDFRRNHADARGRIDAWLCEAKEAEWRTPADIKARYPSASILSGNRFIFDIKGNSYRLEVKVAFKYQTVVITRIGTHAEYIKWKF